MVSEAKRLYKECGIDEPTLCMTLHPQGSPLEEKVELHRRVLHEMLEKLAGTPIKVGVLFQTVLGHRVDSRCDEPWQHVENLENTESGRMCILDPHYREYTYNMVRTIAAEHPYSLMVDDDFRQINVAGLECFCPAHMAQFNEGLEHPLTADELKEAVRNARPGDPLLERFERLRRQNLIDVAKLIRKAIDSVAPGLRCGCCTPAWEFLIEKDIALALAGDTKPLVRFCNGNYLEGDAKTFPYIAYKNAILRQMMPGIEDFLDEADTCPHNRYSKSAKSLHAKLVLAILSKVCGAKLWLTNTEVPDPWTERKYDTILAKHKKYYPALEQMMKNAEPAGLITPLPEQKAYKKMWHPLHMGKCLYTEEWQLQLLAHYGIPGCYGPLTKDGVRMLTADMLRFFDNDEIGVMLAGKLLLDRAAAVELVHRGFGPDLGIRLGKMELWSTEEVWNDGYRGIPFSSSGEKEVPVPLSDRTKVLSNLIYSRFHKDPAPRPVAAGCMLFDNVRGGRVAISTQTLGEGPRPYPRSRHQLIALLEALIGKDLPLYVECDRNVFTRQFTLTDGAALLGVFNLNFDELENIELKGSMKYENVEFLTPEGVWAPAPRTGNTVNIELRTYDCAILKLS
jgi:hypothetical protein